MLVRNTFTTFVHVYQGYVNIALYLPPHRPSRLELGSNGRQGQGGTHTRLYALRRDSARP